MHTCGSINPWKPHSPSVGARTYRNGVVSGDEDGARLRQRCDTSRLSTAWRGLWGFGSNDMEENPLQRSHQALHTDKAQAK